MKLIQKLMRAEPSVSRLTRSCAMGIFLAFSPFLGIQTFLVFLLGWPLRLNVTVIFIVLYAVNNPWTMLPIVGLDYAVGMVVLEKWLGVNAAAYNPRWMDWINNKIGPYLKKVMCIDHVNFLTYLVGGAIVSLLITIILYPYLKRLFVRLKAKHA